MKSSRFSTLYFLFSILNGPLFSLYGLVPFILYKELNASAFTLTVVTTLKPVVAVFSSYWTHRLSSGHDHLKSNLIGAALIGIVPTLLFAHLGSAPFLIIAFGFYFFAERAFVPALIELVKRSTPPSQHSDVIGKAGVLNFTLSAICPLFLSAFLDLYPNYWKWLFPVLGGISLLRLLLLIGLPVHPSSPTRPYSLLSPWKESWDILKKRPDFALYQWIFFFGGLGLMVMHPSLPIIIKDHLNFSYTEIATAIALCKGVGFVLTTPLWTKYLKRSHIYIFCALVTFSAALSLALIELSITLPFCLYFAYFVYGVMQAGSQLSWHLGGPIFSPNEDSSSFTSINVVMVGVRGSIGPLLGGILLSYFGCQSALIAGMLLCLTGSIIGILGKSRIPLQIYASAK